MRIMFQREKARRVSGELLTLSRTVRQAGYELEDILRELRFETEFEKCARDLRREIETLNLLTARIVNLSVALNEIEELYRLAETRNGERLEGPSGAYYIPVSGGLHLSGGDTRAQIERILYP